jgi:hypothetical protein
MIIEKAFMQVKHFFQYDQDIQIIRDPCGQQFLLHVAQSIYVSIATWCTGYEIALLSSENKIQSVKQLGYDPVKPVQYDEIISEIEKIRDFFTQQVGHL